MIAFLLFSSSAKAGDLVVSPDVAVKSTGDGEENIPETNQPTCRPTFSKRRTAGDVIPSEVAASVAGDQELREEQQLMEGVIRILDRETAGHWLSSFISAPPMSCPQQQQRAWIQAILDGVERNRLPICKEILALTASLISIESSFRVDPLAVDASRGESIVRLVERAEYEFMEKYGALVQLPFVSQMYASYKEKYYHRLIDCHTEGQVELVARAIAQDLKKDSEKFPKFVRTVIDKELDKLIHVVRTKGSMQLNYLRATEVLKARGERFNDQELTDYMYSLHGGVDAGVAALAPMFVQYAARYGKPGDLSWLFFVGMDYHYGPFSSRNMMEQIRIRDLSGKKIDIDGDFLHYDDKGKPLVDRESDTLQATLAAFPELSQSTVLKAFLQEKDRRYIYTSVHKTIDDAHRQRYGDTPFAVIGDLWMGQATLVKHGSMWRTQSYLKKLDRYLNSVPWDQQ